MKSQGLLPNVVTYTTLVDIYGKSGKFHDAIECLEVMESDGLKPSSTMYNALINAYAQRVCCCLKTYLHKSVVGYQISPVFIAAYQSYLLFATASFR